VLAASAQEILRRLPDSAVVLDVGGAARPFPRADWILDLAPYDARGQLGWQGERAAERFDASRWVQRDICDRAPWPFDDDQFDFAICSHTLEDIRDPVWACAELQRVARAGYIEVPALREELTYGIQGPWVGWGHHHWLVLTAGDGVEFVFKHHVVNRRGSHRPAGSADGLSQAERVQPFWWEETFTARERFLLTAPELDGFLERLAHEGLPRRRRGRRVPWPRRR
jgi:Methyltransferase domain